MSCFSRSKEKKGLKKKKFKTKIRLARRSTLQREGKPIKVSFSVEIFTEMNFPHFSHIEFQSRDEKHEKNVFYQKNAFFCREKTFDFKVG